MLKFAKLTPEATIPTRNHPNDAGLDLYSPTVLYIHPGHFSKIPLGLSCQFPAGYMLYVQARSGHGLNHGIFTAGNVIDPDYRGEIHVGLYNFSQKGFQIEKGDRIAQAILVCIHPVPATEVDFSELTDTVRGTRGLGESGR